MGHKTAEPADVHRLFEEGTAIDEALQRAVREALLMHKKLGNPVAIWRDGKVVLLQPDEILVDEK